MHPQWKISRYEYHFVFFFSLHSLPALKNTPLFVIVGLIGMVKEGEEYSPVISFYADPDPNETFFRVDENGKSHKVDKPHTIIRGKVNIRIGKHANNSFDIGSLPEQLVPYFVPAYLFSC